MSKVITFPFGEPFLERLTDYVDQNFIRKNKDLSRVAIVFGGKRPAVFLKRELARRIKTNFYPPRVFTIDEFISNIVKKNETFTPSKDLDQCYTIYKIAQEITPQILKGRETFAEFLPWTKEILSFIDQLDLEGVADERLKAIESNARIGYSVPKDINRLLETIVSLRQAYHKYCRGGPPWPPANGLAQGPAPTYSRGMLYRRAAELSGETDFAEFDQILFCNFFYFNQCEEKVIQSLLAQKKATLIFQGDERKWPVLERTAKKLNLSIREGEEIAPPQFNLQLYSAFDVHAQVGTVREILKNIPEKEKTVIVLPQTDHLIPLISEVASLVSDFNVSMGYPLRRSSLYALFQLIFKAQLSKKDGRYYAKDYLNVLRHPFVKNLKLHEEPAVMRVLIHKIEEILTGQEKTSLSGSSFIDLEELAACEDVYILTAEILKRLGLQIPKRVLPISELHDILFKRWEGIKNFKGFSQVLKEFLDIFVEKSFLKNYPLNINIADRLYEIQTEFETAAFHKEEFPQEEIFKIFENKISSELVSFKGTPLKGLQILGLFETRSLHFDHVIVMDVNEGVLPKLNIFEPLIPREVMVSLNLDRVELEEEIQRYQFMRLISCARNVHLVYQEGKEKERSRFIEELIWEEEKRGGRGVPLQRAQFEVKVAREQRAVRKTPQMIEFLKNFSYSASSINTYLKNPMEFYYSYVLGLKEKDDLLDEPEARHVGTFLHELLEESFKPFLGKKPEINAGFRSRVQKLFDRKFEETFGKGLGSEAFLLQSVLKERVSRFLDNEENNAGRKIKELLYLEHRFEEAIPLSMGPIKFKYIVDRVDRLEDGTIMIIDYKTGFIDQMPKAIDRIESLELSRETIRDCVKSFQIPLYFHYLNQQFKNEPINAALYNLRTLQLHAFLDDRMTYPREQINKAFLRALDFIIGEILNPEVQFVEEIAPFFT